MTQSVSLPGRISHGSLLLHSVMAWFDDYIDAAIPLDARARRGVHRSAWRRWMAQPGNQLRYALGLGLAITMFLFLPDMIDGMLGLHHWLSSVGALVVYVGLLGVLLLMLRRSRFAPCVHAELRARGFDVCPRCGYWLRGRAEDASACPECGERVPELPA